jgi:hypothetical protein
VLAIANQHIRKATHENLCPITIENAPMTGGGLIARAAERPLNGLPSFRNGEQAVLHENARRLERS